MINVCLAVRKQSPTGRGAVIDLHGFHITVKGVKAMACVRDLLKQESLRDAKLVAGRNGLYRTISWPNVAQTPSIREWLIGGDVIITTGIGVSCTPETLHTILEQALEAHSACLVVFLSDMYIQELPQETLAEADKSNFPIFTVPWDTLIANIIRDISQLLLMERYQAESINLLIEDLLFRSDTIPSESLLAFIKRQNLTTNHAVMMVEWQNEQGFGDQFRRGIISRQQSANLLTQALRQTFPKALYLDRQQYTYFLIRLEKEQLNVLSRLCARLCQNIHARYPGICVRIGIGQIYSDPLQLYLSVSEARKALGLCSLGREVVRFDELGLYQLLINIPDQLLVRNFAVSRLKPLLDYDLKNEKEFLHTLEIFLHCNCNVNQAAKKLFVHRNTLSYQIERIKELLDVDLDNAETRNMLFNCLKIYRYCQK